MKTTPEFVALGCRDCRSLDALEIDFSMAFQPIVDVSTQTVFGYEALVRGLQGESAATILGQVDDTNRYRFDQACRVKAIDLAARLGLQGMLSINFLPNAVYRAETCIRATLEAAREHDFPTDRIMFEVTEGERVTDHAHLKNILTTYKELGFMTAIDDFGAGYSGLNLLAEFQPDLIKIDMALTRSIDQDRVRRAIVFAILAACRELDIRVIAEGVETREECLTLADEGVELFQGYLFARPQFEQLPAIPASNWAAVESRRTARASLRSGRH
jgi:EAL domain-containing protein (putative c-di-GMP-specific phosphodiesterase class I)